MSFLKLNLIGIEEKRKSQKVYKKWPEFENMGLEEVIKNYCWNGMDHDRSGEASIDYFRQMFI